jgi:probable rRNA maturation factor
MIEIVDEQYNLDREFYLPKLEKVFNDLHLDGAITIKIGDSEESKALNTNYRKKDYPTDVLSFPFDEDLPDGYYIGDIFVCYPVAEAQAKENGISLEEELFTLMVHGILHLAGHDHETDDGRMSELQEQLVKAYFHNE